MFKVIPNHTNYELNSNGDIRHILSGNSLKVYRTARDGSPMYRLLQDDGAIVEKVLHPMVMELFPESFPGKEIPGFPGYNATEDGKIFSVRSNKFLTTTFRKRHGTGKEQESVGLSRIGASGKRISSTYSVHRIVASTFIPNPDNKPEVNHIDGDPSNNHVSNLEWTTKVENTKHAVDNYLYERQQRSVDVWRKEDKQFVGWFKSMQQAADYLGMKSKNANKNISEVCAKNASDKLNRGVDNKINPFSSEGYIFKFAEAL